MSAWGEQFNSNLGWVGGTLDPNLKLRRKTRVGCGHLGSSVYRWGIGTLSKFSHGDAGDRGVSDLTEDHD